MTIAVEYNMILNIGEPFLVDNIITSRRKNESA
jgi:hypothetical protein